MSAVTVMQLPLIGARLGRYDVLSEIAHGGMAAVYAVRLHSIAGFGKTLAMKVLLPHLGSDREFIDMFLDEARIASNIQHPNVVQVFDLGIENGMPFLVMEFLRGRSLSGLQKKLRESHRKLPPAIVFGVLARAADGLHAAHTATDEQGEALGIVHRDVSPQNIHVGYDGHVKVVDFGIAAARNRLTSTRSGQVKGKFAYLSPEQATPEATVDGRSDLFALGVVAWELLAGRSLFRDKEDAGTLWNVMSKPVPNLGEIVPDLPPRAVEVIHACLERSADKRPENAAEVASVLDQAAAELGGASPREIKRLMHEVFHEERAAENDRLSKVQPDGEASSPSQLSGIAVARTMTHHAPKPRRWPAILGIVVALLAIGGTSITLALMSNGPRADPRATVAPPEPAVLHEVVVRIDPEPRLVLVDGVRRGDRPIRLQLAEDATAFVEAIADNGEVIQRVVRASDGEVALAFTPPVEVGAPTEPAEERPSRDVRTRRTTSTRMVAPTPEDSAASTMAPPPNDEGTAMMRGRLFDDPYTAP